MTFALIPSFGCERHVAPALHSKRGYRIDRALIVW